MSWKIDVVLLQAIKWIWQKNDVVSVSIAYAKNVLLPKWQAKQADALVKNNLAQKKEQQKKHLTIVSEIRDSLHLYVQAKEELLIKKKVTPSGWLYEKVHESDVKELFHQWKITLPAEISIVKQVWDTPWVHTATLQRGIKKLHVPFIIKESIY